MPEERSSRHQPPQMAGGPPKRPLPKWMFGLLNPFIRALLRSPLHHLVSKDFMVLSFTGRRSGKPYAVPVGYVQQANRLYFSCLAGWWTNLPGTAVTVRLRGRDYRGVARRIANPDGITQVARLLIAKRGEALAKRIGLLAALADAEAGSTPRRPVFIQIDLEGHPG